MRRRPPRKPPRRPPPRPLRPGLPDRWLLDQGIWWGYTGRAITHACPEFVVPRLPPDHPLRRPS